MRRLQSGNPKIMFRLCSDSIKFLDQGADKFSTVERIKGFNLFNKITQVGRLAVLGSVVILQACSGGGGKSGDEGKAPPTEPAAPVELSPTLTINSGALKTSSQTVTLTLGANSATDMLITQTADCGGGSWEPFAATKSWSLATSNALNTVFYKARRGASESACVSATITHDNTAPSVTVTSISENAYINSSQVASVAIEGACSENGVVVSISGAATGTALCSGGAYAFSTNLSAASEGALAVTVQQTDDVGNVGTAVRNFLKDTVAPTSNSIAINAGAVSTNSMSVTLSLASTGAIEMFISDSVTCAIGAWESFSASKSWNLSAANQSVSVYVKFRDSAGNESSCADDSIFHDNIGASVAFLAPAANSYVTPANQASWSINGTCSEEGQLVSFSGAVSGSTACSSNAWSASFDLSALAEGSFGVSISQADLTGNTGNASRSFIKDTTAPSSVSLAINSGATHTNSVNVSLQVSAVGASQMILSDSIICSGSWEPYSASKSYTLAQLNDVNTVYLKVRDAALNESSCISSSIVHDTMAPSVAITSPAANSVVSSANQNAFGVSGTCSEEGRTVTISGAGSGSALCAGGIWSANVNLTSAAQGSITLSISQSDVAGNSGSGSRGFVKDTVGPTGNSIQIGGGALATSLLTMSVSLVSSDAAEMYLTEDSACATGGAWVAFQSSDVWTFTDTDTTVRLYALFKDSNGNLSSCVNDSIIQDSSAPDWTDEPTHVSGFNSLTESPAVIYPQTAVDTGSGIFKYQYAIGTGIAGGAATDIRSWTDVSGGAFSATGLSLSESVTYYVNMKVIDNAGNESGVSSSGWIVDTTPPLVAVTSPISGSTLSDEDFKVSGTCDSSVGDVAVSYAGVGITGETVASCVSGAFSFFVRIVSSGAKTIAVSQSDGINPPTEVLVSINFVKPLEFSGPVLRSKPLADGSVLYAGGFNSLSYQRDFGIARAATTGERDVSSSFGSGFNGFVYAMVELDDGSVVVGGDFTRYRGRVANRIAKISSSGELDLTFNPQSGGNGLDNTVFALTRNGSGAGTSIFVGGQFTAYRSVANSSLRLAKLDVNGALDTAFTLQSSGMSSTVRALLVEGSYLYVGGEFTTYRGSVANRLAKLNLDGTLDFSFNPITGGNGVNNIVRAIATDGSYLYVGGDFSQVRGLSANRIAKISFSGDRDATFSPGTNGSSSGSVNAVAVSGTSVYFGGSIVNYRGALANRVAKVTNTGVLDTTFSPSSGANGFNNTVSAIVIDSGDVIIGGYFSSYKGIDANYVARINSSGVFNSVFHPESGGAGASYAVTALHVGGASGKLWLGGGFTHYRSEQYIANHFVRIMSDGSIDETLSPQSGASGFNGLVRDFDLSADGSTLYFAGDFTMYQGQPANYIAKVATNDGLLDETFNPSSGGNGVNGTVRAVHYVDDTTIFFGGDFTSYLKPSTLIANRVMRVDSDGVLNQTFSPQTGGNGTSSSSLYVTDFAVIGTNLYIAGAFTKYRGVTANRIAKVDFNGAMDTAFTNSNGFSSTVNTLATDGTALYAGGAFTTFKGAVANRGAKISTAGTLDTGFNPSSGANGYSSTVNAMEICSDGANTYILAVGVFTKYRNVTANRVAKVSALGALDTTFNGASGLNGVTGTPSSVQSVSCNSSSIHIGGNFQVYRGRQMSNQIKVNYSGVLE